MVSLELNQHRDEALSALAFIESGEHLKPSYKKATFSMSAVAIDELGNLTQERWYEQIPAAAPFHSLLLFAHSGRASDHL